MLTRYSPTSPSIPPTPEEIQRQLPERLAAALERRWYENFEPYIQAIAPHAGGDVQAETRVLEILEVKHGPDKARSLHLLNMQNVLSSLRDGSHSLLYSVSSDGQKIKLHMGVRHFQDRAHALSLSTHDYVDVLSHALRSNYPGIVLSPEPISHEEYDEALLYPLENSRYLAGITGIPSLKQDMMTSAFAQSIDRFVDALRGESYNLLILAEPVWDTQLNDILFRLRRLSEEIHLLVNQTISKTRGETRTEGRSSGSSTGVTIGFGQLSSLLFGPSINQSMNQSTSLQTGISESGTLTQEALNKTAQFCEQMLDHYLTRIQSARNLGFWNVGVYLATESQNTFLRTQGIARSLYAGQHTHFEPLRILDLSYADAARRALAHLRNPYLNTGDHEIHPLGKEFHSLGTPLTTEELSTLVSLPNQEVPGLKLQQVADFNLNPPPLEGFELGTLLYRGEKLATRVAVSSKSLTRHTFVTGLTGSGKTNTCLALLADAYRNRRLKFLVIDPAKTEYRFLLHAPSLGEDLLIFTLGDEQTAPFRLNPFEFVPGFPLLTHIDLLKAVFNAAFPMYASMPYLLEEALIAVYQERGWDITRSSNRFVSTNSPADYAAYLPRLGDLYAKIDEVVASKRYDVRLTLDLTAALKARLGSLLRGGKGLMLDTQRSTPISELLNRPVVLELQSIGDDDEKAFVMALLFVKLYEAGRSRPLDGQLQHVTLIEEAHRLLRNVPVVAGAESANPRGKTVEMFTDMMAEMRARGEGFIVVDQMPGKLVPDVIKGSNLKIVHRLLAQDDRQSVGNAMGMIPSQIDYLPRLTVGQAVVHSEEVEEACLVQIDAVEDDLTGQQPGRTPQEKELLTAKQLHAKTDAFYASQRQIFHRYAACQLCEAPCTYYDPELERHWEPALELAARFITVVAVGQAGAIQALWKRLRDELTRLHQFLYPKAPIDPGYMRCLCIGLAAETARRFYQHYPHADYTKAILDLQLDLARTWESKTLNSEALTGLRLLITKGIATLPLNARPGCVSCPARCWFGHRFQNENHPAVRALTAELKTSPSGKRLNLEEVTGLAVRTFGANLEPRLHTAAAYCLLSQTTANENLLTDFRHRAFSPKP